MKINMGCPSLLLAKTVRVTRLWTLFARLFVPHYVRNKFTLPFFLMTSELPSHFYLRPYNVALHCLVAPKVRRYDQKYQLGVGGGRGCFPFILTDCFDFHFAEVSLRILILSLLQPCMGSHSCRWAVSFCCLLINVLSQAIFLKCLVN